MKPHKRLIALTAAGNFRAAFALVKDKPVNSVKRLMCRAGFQVAGEENKKDFWEEVQGSLEDACRTHSKGAKHV
ncbi:hypothetical protein ACO0LB_18050 [Undibacterium sp. SXout7W]|uniref:hypothetical protein n=1 Tax=Undibacterium sp. SXout7W TaxID=3413049 RepID=UPI003BF183C8